MRDPQIWALMLTAIGVLATMMFAMHRLTVREMSARFDAVDAKFEARFDVVDRKFAALEGVMNARFADVDHRLSSVETDLGIIKASLIGQRSA